MWLYDTISVIQFTAIEYILQTEAHKQWIVVSIVNGPETNSDICWIPEMLKTKVDNFCRNFVPSFKLGALTIDASWCANF